MPDARTAAPHVRSCFPYHWPVEAHRRCCDHDCRPPAGGSGFGIIAGRHALGIIGTGAAVTLLSVRRWRHVTAVHWLSAGHGDEWVFAGAAAAAVDRAAAGARAGRLVQSRQRLGWIRLHDVRQRCGGASSTACATVLTMLISPHRWVRHHHRYWLLRARRDSGL